MTYRDRRQAKAERLREWAEKRDEKADANRETVDRLSDVMQGQPILVGHHSEKRHRNDLNRMFNNMSKGVENQRKADEFRRRADNIEAAADNSIYSDDPDAIEQLERRIASLEASRTEMKQDNTAFRKEHKVRLKSLSSYERDLAMPYQSFELQNLSGNINRQKKRLAQLKAKWGES